MLLYHWTVPLHAQRSKINLKLLRKIIKELLSSEVSSTALFLKPFHKFSRSRIMKSSWLTCMWLKVISTPRCKRNRCLLMIKIQWLSSWKEKLFRLCFAQSSVPSWWLWCQRKPMPQSLGSKKSKFSASSLRIFWTLVSASNQITCWCSNAYHS